MDLNTLLSLPWITITLLPVLPFASTYITTLCMSKLVAKGISTSEDPPPVPYCVPLVGNALPLAFDTLDFMDSIVYVSSCS